MSEIQNEDRVNAVIIALERLPHDQSAIGIGFDLKHDARKCARCIAFTYLMQLSNILRRYEGTKGENTSTETG